MNCVGTGIYLNASVIDHSCCPNATTVFDGSTLYVRSVEDIPDFHMNKVIISYGTKILSGCAIIIFNKNIRLFGFRLEFHTSIF